MLLALACLILSVGCGPVEEAVDESLYVDKGLRLIVVSSNHWARPEIRFELERLAANWERSARYTVVEIVSDVEPFGATATAQDALDVRDRIQEARDVAARTHGRIRYDGLMLVGDVPTAHLKSSQVIGFFTSDVVYSHYRIEWQASLRTGAIEQFDWYDGYRLESVSFGRLTLYTEQGTPDFAATQGYLNRLNDYYETNASSPAPSGTLFRLAQFVDGGLSPDYAARSFSVGVIDGADVESVRDTTCGLDSTSGDALQGLVSEPEGFEVLSILAHGSPVRLRLAQTMIVNERGVCIDNGTPEIVNFTGLSQNGIAARFALFGACNASAWGAFQCATGGATECDRLDRPRDNFRVEWQSLCMLTLRRGKTLACVGSTIDSYGLDENDVLSVFAAGAGIGESLRAAQNGILDDDWFSEFNNGNYWVPIDNNFAIVMSQHVFGDPFVRTAARNRLFDNITGYYRPADGTDLDAAMTREYGLEFSDDSDSSGVVLLWDRSEAAIDRAVLGYDVILSTWRSGSGNQENTRMTIPVAALGRSEGRWAAWVQNDLEFDYWAATVTAIYQDGHVGPKRTVPCFMPRSTDFHLCGN